MRLRHWILTLGWLSAAPAFASCSDLPWHFGMSPAEVSAITECGPYQSFKNGDLETYKGVFDGKEENFQFFFAGGRLRRIGISLYEGQDATAGAQAWLKLHGQMTRQFGAVETPGNALESQDEAARAAFSAKALEIVQRIRKTQMAPRAQPKDANSFASFFQQDVNGTAWYYVTLYLDEPS